VADRLPRPGRLRARLAIAFVLVTGVLTGALAIGTYAVVRNAVLGDSLDRAEREARFGLELAADLSPRSDLQPFVDAFGRRGVDAVLVVGSRRVVSDPGLSPAIPASLRDIVASGHLGSARLDLASAPYLIVGGRPPGSRMQLYLLFSERAQRRDLATLRAVLAGGWLVALVVATAAGWLVAGRTLAPVGRASRAARALAEGLLDTRLPVDGRDEFGAWAASFNEMADALEGKIAALQAAGERERRFTGDVAHELRTPITALVSEASLLLERLDEMPPETRRVAEMLAGDVARVRRLVEDLIEVSRLDAGADPVRSEPFDLGAMVRRIAGARSAGERVDVEAPTLDVVSDPRRIERIVGNLADNALRHGAPPVEIRVARSGDDVIVEVSDRGPGIAAEDRAHVFERFYKADRSRAGGGTGLGLAIALENARALGGEIALVDRDGPGVSFRLRLPVTEPLPRGDGAVSSVGHAGGDTSQTGGGPP
jgi:two-component system, OmpR family, sensor histidine kinase MtrB